MLGTIVIADSSPVFRHGLEHILLQRGDVAKILHAETGDELESMLDHTEPDLIIIDCMAPQFSVDNVLSCQRKRQASKSSPSRQRTVDKVLFMPSEQELPAT